MNETRTALSLGLVLAIGLSAAGLALAQTGRGYDMTWWTADGGGGISEGEGYTLTSTVGQPDAGGTVSGADYDLTTGFWPSTTADYRTYLPVVLCNR